MRRTALLAVFLLIAVNADARTRPSGKWHPDADTRYLDAARGIAAWLETLEINDGGALSWPISPGTRQIWPGIETGSAGIGAFHLKLYEVTREPRYLQKAEGAARYVRRQYAANVTNGHDWLAGATGGGEYFVAMYEATGDRTHLDAARETAELLLGRAIRGDGEMHWQHTTVTRTYVGLAHGAAGVGLFLVRVWELTQEQKYLDAAREAAAWMSRHQIPLRDNSIGWRRLTTDADATTTWCGGSIGIVHFLEALHRATGDARYRDLRQATLEGFVREAVVVAASPEQIAWRYSAPSTVNAFPLVYCHGGSSVGSILARAYAENGDVRYLQAAAGSARWLDAVSTRQPSGQSWTQTYGWLTGSASIGHASLQLYAATRDAQHLNRARSTGDHLLAVADRPAPGQFRWPTDSSASGDARFETGWYTGASGIGIFLLELHQASLRHAPLAPFSLLNP